MENAINLPQCLPDVLGHRLILLILQVSQSGEKNKKKKSNNITTIHKVEVMEMTNGRKWEDQGEYQ